MPPVSNEGVMEYGEPITAAFEAPPEVTKVAEVAAPKEAKEKLN